MPRFEVYRLVLSVPPMGPLFKGKEKDREPSLSRRDYLQEVLSKRRDFFYRTRLMVYMPSPPESVVGSRFSGFVGRKSTQQHGAGPEQLFAETKTETWKASFVALDIAADQQLVMFEKRADVGSGRGILIALFEQMSAHYNGATWHVDVEYLWDEGDFWEAAKHYRGEITDLQFRFAPANGLEGFEEFKKFDKLAKRQANAEVSDYNLKNKNGQINPSGDFVESAVEYASEGAGEAVLKNGNRKLFSSKKSRITEHAPESLMPRQRELPKILGLVAYLFGRISKKKKSDD